MPQIVDELREIGARQNDDTWRVGGLVNEAIRIGLPGVHTGAKRIIAYLAENAPAYQKSTLNTYRKIFAAYVDETTGALDIVAGVSFAAHRAVMGRDDRRELLTTLVAEAGNRPELVTVAAVKASARMRDEVEYQAVYGGRVESFDVFGPLSNALAQVRYDMEVAAVWVQRGGMPQSAEQRVEIKKYVDYLRRQALALKRFVHDPNATVAPDTDPGGLVNQICAEIRALTPPTMP